MNLMKDTYKTNTTSRAKEKELKKLKLSEHVINKIKSTAIGLTPYQYNERYNR